MLLADYTLYPSLEADVRIPENGILSRTLHNDDHVKVVRFGFAPGQELLAHTAPRAAPLNLVRGEANLILSRTPVVMPSTMHKQARGRKQQWPGNGPQSARCSVCA